MCIAAEGKEEMFIIKDKSSGINYDIRQESTTVMLKEADKMLTKINDLGPKKKPWEEWWTQKKEKGFDLLSAAETGDMGLLKDLLDFGKYGDLIADVNTKGLDDYTALHTAASEGHAEVVDYLLNRGGAFVDPLTVSLRTPLHIACTRANLEIIKMLCNAKANINAQDKDGDTPLHMLSECGYQTGLMFMLKKKPDLTIKNRFCETAAEVAVSLEVRQLFAECESRGATYDYSRTVVDNFILHNNRADMIKSLLFKSRLIVDQMQKASASSTTEKHDPEVKANSSKIENNAKTRIIRIIEATKKATDQEQLAKDSKLEKKLSNNKLGVEEEKGSKKEEDAKEKKVMLKKESSEHALPEDFLPIQLLGKGSFGEVYLTKYKPTGRMYAMKILPKKKVMSQNLMKYARAERNVLSYTKHPFIVGMDFAFQTSENLFLMMDFCPGYSFYSLRTI